MTPKILNLLQIFLIIHRIGWCYNSLREKCPYLPFFWFVFSRIRTEYREILCIIQSKNAKSIPAKLRIRTLFTQCKVIIKTYGVIVLYSQYHEHWLASNYMFQVNNRNTRTRCDICSKLTIKIRRRSGVFTVNFEYISHLVLVLLLLTLSR